MDGHVELVELLLYVARHGRIANVGVDLAFGGDTDAHRFQPAGNMDLVRRDHHAAGCDFVANEFRRQVFAFGDIFDFRRDLAAAGGLKLSAH
jgi:hypothetical protein